MNRLTRPGIHVDDSAARYIGNETRIQDVGDRLLELILNGPTLQSFSKDRLRHMMRQLYARLEQYENTGVTPEEIEQIKTRIERVWKLLQDIDEEKLKHLEELVDAENEGRLKIVKRAPEGAKCGNCVDFIRDVGTASGTCRTQPRKRMGQRNTMRKVGQSTTACREFKPLETAQAALAADKNDGCKKVNDLYDEEGGEILGETKDG